MSNKIVIECSVVTGIHITGVGSHEALALAVEKDDSIPHIDPMCMKVVCPNKVDECFLKAVTYPKNPQRKRFYDQHVEDILGKKVGNVPANICKLFRRLIDNGHVQEIKW